MASIVSVVGAGLSVQGLKQTRGGSGEARFTYSPFSVAVDAATRRRLVVVRAEAQAQAQAINPEIRKSEEKVVDSVLVSDLSKPLTAYCRCWRSGTFPLCDGSHVKHNKATGDNVGPLLLKKPKE